MRVNVWLIYKKDEPRVYTRTTQPSDEQAAQWRKEGFKIYRGVLLLPLADDTLMDDIVMAAVDVESADGNLQGG